MSSAFVEELVRGLAVTKGRHVLTELVLNFGIKGVRNLIEKLSENLPEF